MRIFNKVIEKSNQDLFFIGCPHLGNSLCDEKHLKKDLDEARRRNARVIGLGDLIDSIFPDDPRFLSHIPVKRISNKTSIADEAIEYATDILLPYADLIDILGDGNHEYEFDKRHKTNIIMRLVQALNTKAGTHIRYGGYMFYMIYTFKPYPTSDQSKNFLVLGHHGKGSSAPVSKGMIDVARFREAGWKYHLLAFAHKHKSFGDRELFCEPSNNRGCLRLNVEPCRSIQVGTYKKNYLVQDEFDSDIANWEEKQGFSLTNIGGVFVGVRVYQNGKDDRRLSFDIRAEI